MGLSPAASFTPYENARRLGRAVPEGREPIDSITESYVQFSFSGRRMQASNSGALVAWQALRPTLWRSWMNRKLRQRTPPERKPVHPS